MNKTFELKKFQVKPEKKDFPTGTDNSKYICLTSESELIELIDENIPQLEYDVAKFTKIDKLEAMNVNSNCGNFMDTGSSFLCLQFIFTDYRYSCHYVRRSGAADHFEW